MKTCNSIKTSMLALVLPVVAFALATAADSPLVINFQGRLTDPGGNPVPNDDYALTFSIWDSESGGEQLWGETHASVATTDGMFNVRLGEYDTLEVTVLRATMTKRIRYLQIQIGSDAPMTPRILLDYVPYAGIARAVDGDFVSGPGRIALVDTLSGDTAFSTKVSHDIGKNAIQNLKAIGSSGDTSGVILEVDTGLARFSVSRSGTSATDRFSVELSEDIIGVSSLSMRLPNIASTEARHYNYGTDSVKTESRYSASVLGVSRTSSQSADINESKTEIFSVDPTAVDSVSVRAGGGVVTSSTSSNSRFGPTVSRFVQLDVTQPSITEQTKVISGTGETWCVEDINPSGNREWETFRLESGDTTQRIQIELIPPGMYFWELDGAETHIFTDGFESGDVSAWSSSVRGDAANGGRVKVEKVNEGKAELTPLKGLTFEDFLGDTMSIFGPGGLDLWDNDSLYAGMTPGEIFADGFESGDVSIWSSSVGGTSSSGGKVRLSKTGSSDADLTPENGLIFSDNLNDSTTYGLNKAEMAESGGGGVSRLDAMPTGVDISYIGSSGEDGISIDGGGGGGGRIVLREREAAEPIPVEIIALSLKSSEPLMAVRPHTTDPTAPSLWELTFDGGSGLVNTRRARGVDAADSTVARANGLQIFDGTMELLYDNSGVRAIDQGLGGAVNFQLSASGDLTAVRNGVMATEPGTMVGIGTPAPSQKLEVMGNICASGTIGPCSDKRYKKNIETITGALERIRELRGVEFDWRRDEFPDKQFSPERQLGFVAQEVKALIPGVVSKGKDGYYSVDYGRLTPLLVEAIRQQQRQIEEQERDILTMKGQLSQLAAQMQVLETERNGSNTGSDELAGIGE